VRDLWPRVDIRKILLQSLRYPHRSDRTGCASVAWDFAGSITICAPTASAAVCERTRALEDEYLRRNPDRVIDARLVFQRAFERFSDGQVSWDAETAMLSGRMFWHFEYYPASLHLKGSPSSTIAELSAPTAKPAALASIRARYADTLRHGNDSTFKPNKTGAGSWANFYTMGPRYRALTWFGLFALGMVLIATFHALKSEANSGVADSSNSKGVRPGMSLASAEQLYDCYPDGANAISCPFKVTVKNQSNEAQEFVLMNLRLADSNGNVYSTNADGSQGLVNVPPHNSVDAVVGFTADYNAVLTRVQSEEIGSVAITKAP
jgi:hypothetical protein